MHAKACIMPAMSYKLLTDIEEFRRETGIGEYRFGILAVRNGRLIERLKAGRRIWPETEAEIRAFMISERRRAPSPKQEGASA